MRDEFIIDKVPMNQYSFTQVDNKYAPYISCFPTSMGMAMTYCLKSIGKSKIDVGCGPDMQIEDYINHLIDDQETQKWIKDNNVKYGSWMLNYIWKGNAARQILYVETYVFNRLMQEHGFLAEAYTNLQYDQYCEKIEENNCPIVISGNFSSVSRIKGHVTCGIGFNRKNLKELIVHDPYGNALDGYPKTEIKATGVRYPVKFFIMDKYNNMYANVIKKI